MTSSRSIASTSSRAAGRAVLALVVTLVALIVTAGVAEARRRIVVLEFSGPKAAQFQGQIEGVLKKSASLVPQSKWDDAADELGATKVTAKNVAKVAAKLNVDGVVVGSVDRRGSRYFVHVRLRQGASGEFTAEVELIARSGKLTSSDLDEVKDQIVGAIEQLPAPGAGDDGDDEPVAKGKGKGHGKTKVAAGDDDDGGSAADDDDDGARGKGKGKSKGKGAGKHKLDDDDGGGAADDDGDAPPKDKDKHRGFRGHDKDDGDPSADDGDDAPRGKAKGGKAKGKGGKAKGDDDAVADDSDDDAPRGKAKGGKAKGKGGKAKGDDDDGGDRDGDKGDRDGGDHDRGDRDGDKGDRDDGDRVADRDGDRDGDADADSEELEGGTELLADPRHRPVDALAGFSFTARRLDFTTTPGLTNKPQGYKSGVPVTGLYVGADLYPLAFNAKNKSITRDFGVTVLLDRVISISSQLSYKDMAGAAQTATLGTTEQHYALGIVWRHTLGHAPTDPTIFASIRYNRSKFVIDKAAAPTGVTVDIPNVDYTYIDPGVAIRYPLSPKLALDGGARFLLITNTGEMQSPTQYGGATVYGFDLDAGGDYTLNKQWFVHAGLHLSTIGFSFKGNGALTTMRDNDPTTIDVQGARDTYYGGMVTAGYLY